MDPTVHTVKDELDVPNDVLRTFPKFVVGYMKRSVRFRWWWADVCPFSSAETLDEPFDPAI
eukprot:scaffold148_cov341-Pavlova_lutheri.AAC.12